MHKRLDTEDRAVLERVKTVHGMESLLQYNVLKSKRPINEFKSGLSRSIDVLSID